MVKVHYFGTCEVKLFFNVIYLVLLNDGRQTRVKSRESKRMLLDEDYSLDTPSPEMTMLAMEDFMQRGRKRLLDYPGNAAVLGIKLVDYHLAKFPPCWRT